MAPLSRAVDSVAVPATVTGRTHALAGDVVVVAAAGDHDVALRVVLGFCFRTLVFGARSRARTRAAFARSRTRSSAAFAGAGASRPAGPVELFLGACASVTGSRTRRSSPSTGAIEVFVAAFQVLGCAAVVHAGRIGGTPLLGCRRYHQCLRGRLRNRCSSRRWPFHRFRSCRPCPRWCRRCRCWSQPCPHCPPLPALVPPSLPSPSSSLSLSLSPPQAVDTTTPAGEAKQGLV